VDELLTGLNPAQKEAVTYSGGPLLVLAGAGSGKTRVLTHRAAYLVASGKAEPHNLLLLTFTNKAAEEMRNRLYSLLEKIVEEKNFDRPFAGNFHTFCAYLLRREGPAIGLSRSFVIYDEDDQLSLIKNLMKKMNVDDKNFKPAAIRGVIEHSKNDFLTAEDFLNLHSGSWHQTVGEIYRTYQQNLKKIAALDFTDLLIYGVKLFKEKPEILKKYQRIYRFVLVDEYQDTNKAQYLLTKLLSKESGNLTVVGDAAQAIYSWRGADYRNLLSLSADFPKIKIINLEENYRSTQNILDVSYQVICKNRKHPVLKLKSLQEKGVRPVVFKALSETDEAEFVCEKIKQLTDFCAVAPAEIAVLYRTNAQSRVFEEAFINHNIPYILYGGVKFYERAEVKDVICLLRVIHNQNDIISWGRIEKNFGKRRKEKVKNYLQSRKEKETKVLIEEMLEISSYLQKFDKDKEEDLRKLENIKELLSVAENFPDLTDFLENVALVQQEYSLQEKEKRKKVGEAVKLMTLHASKGLEFAVVFIVGLEEGLLPHYQSLEDEERLEEERRLCYVGMTRAKKFLFLTFAVRRLYFGQTNYNDLSRFLEDIPEELLKKEGNWDEDEDWELE